MRRRIKTVVLMLGLMLAGCGHHREKPVSYYPPAQEIFAGETGQLFDPDDERVPILLGRSVGSLSAGWTAYVAGRNDLVQPLEKQGKIRWTKAGTTVRVITVDDRLGQFFLLVREGSHPEPSPGLLEKPVGWWTDARNFRITVGPAAFSGKETLSQGGKKE